MYVCVSTRSLNVRTHPLAHVNKAPRTKTKQWQLMCNNSQEKVKIPSEGHAGFLVMEDVLV